MGRTEFVPPITGRQAGMRDTDVYLSSFLGYYLFDLRLNDVDSPLAGYSRLSVRRSPLKAW
jgi:hypothetical protein